MVSDAGEGQFPPGGLDSLGAVEMANGVSTALGLKLPQTLVFDYPSVESMSLHLFGLLAPTGTAIIPSIQAPSGTVQTSLQAASAHQPIQVSLPIGFVHMQQNSTSRSAQSSATIKQQLAPPFPSHDRQLDSPVSPILVFSMPNRRFDCGRV